MKRVSYNAKDIAAATAEEQLVDGSIVKVVIDNVECVESDKPPKNPKSGPGTDMMIKWRLSVLNPETGQRIKRHTIFGTTYLPLRDPESDSHLAPEWSHGLASQFVRAFLPDEIDSISWVDGKPYYQDNEIEQSEVAQIKTAIAENQFNIYVDLWNDGPTKLLHRTAYATLKHSDFDGRTFVNADRLRAELGTNQDGTTEELTPMSELIQKVSAVKDNAETTEEVTSEEDVPKRKRRGFFSAGAEA